MSTNELKSVGILGGGQLAMFLCISAQKFNIKVSVFSEQENFSARKFCNNFFIGNFRDIDKIKEFYKSVDIVTVETENIPKKTLLIIENEGKLRPSSETIIISQNRIKEKKFINSLDGIKTTKFKTVNSYSDLTESMRIFGEEFILKSCEFGYDGKNQFKINKYNIDNFKDFGLKNFIAEKIVLFEKEISVIVARDVFKNIQFFPPVKNIHENGILRTSEFPANIKKHTEKKALKQAQKISEKINLIGLLAIEMFVLKEDDIIINELAPRPHNSGHWTLDCCNYNQFDNLILAITNRKTKEPEILFKGKMQNILGDEYTHFNKNKPQITFYDYFKKEIKTKRKMAHFTIKEKFKT